MSIAGTRAQKNEVSNFTAVLKLYLVRSASSQSPREHSGRIYQLFLLGSDLTFDKGGKKETAVRLFFYWRACARTDALALHRHLRRQRRRCGEVGL